MHALSLGCGGPAFDDGGMVRGIGKWLLAICVVIMALACPALCADSAPEKNVLVLYSFSARETFVFLEPLKTTVRSRVSTPVNFYVEYLESERFADAAYRSALGETIRQSYSGANINLVIAVGYPALRFALDYRDEISPNVPVVFLDVASSRLRGTALWHGVTGLTTNVDVRGSLDLALRLHPGTRNVVFIAGDSEFERYWLGAFRDELRQRWEKLNLIEMQALPKQRLLEAMSELPPHTIAFFNLVPLEAAQPEIGPYEVLEIIAQRVPTYCIHNYCLDHGAVGGSYTDSRVSGIKGGELAARVLSGEKPESIQVAQNSVVYPQVDWRQLRRWNIPESALPFGTVVLYRQPTAWERYEKYIFGSALLILSLMLLVIGLLWQWTRRLKAEVTLRESERRFHVMADTSPALIWMSNTEGKVFYRNETQLKFTGSAPDAGAGDGWMNYVHPDDLQSVVAANARALERQQGYSKEYRLRRRDGVYRWMFDVAAPRINGDGGFAGFIGSASDITDQKLAQETLEKMGGRLIEAQERERSRIARELHDDICQRLALLSMELEQVTQRSNGSIAATKARIRDIRKHCSEIAGDVQALSHELHSSKLDYLGIEAAIGSLCREFAQQQNVSAEFTHQDIPGPLPRDVALCLFRVAQEALHNAVKYSGVSQFSVDLRGTAPGIQLEVKDTGTGFDVQEAKRDGGLGLVSMQERVHLVNGTLSVESKVNHGTRILVRVPLAGEMNGLTTAAEGG